MKHNELVKKIKQRAKVDAKNRRDPRFIRVLGFLVGKGFLRTNLKVRSTPNQHLDIQDAIWAGENVEPRILEVLPSAVLRLERHFDFNREKFPELARVIDQLHARQEKGSGFLGIPYEKIKVWADFPLRDRRIKTVGEKKVTKTYRLKREAVNRLKHLSKKLNCSETEALEKKLLAD